MQEKQRLLLKLKEVVEAEQSLAEYALGQEPDSSRSLHPSVWGSEVSSVGDLNSARSSVSNFSIPWGRDVAETGRMRLAETRPRNLPALPQSIWSSMST